MAVIPFKAVYQDGANVSTAQIYSLVWCNTKAELDANVGGRVHGDIGYAGDTFRLYMYANGVWYPIALQVDVPATWNGGAVGNNISINRWVSQYAAGSPPYPQARLVGWSNTKAGLTYNLNISEATGAYFRDDSNQYGCAIDLSGIAAEGPQLRWMNDHPSGTVAEKFRIGPSGEVLSQSNITASGNIDAPNITAHNSINTNYITSNVSINTGNLNASNVITSGYVRSGGNFWEAGRSFPSGVIQAVPYSSSNFSALSPMTWTVPSESLYSYHWSLYGNTMTVWFYHTNSNIAGSGNTSDLYVKIPNGMNGGLYTNTRGVTWIGGAWESMIVMTIPGNPWITLKRQAFGNWNNQGGVQTMFTFTFPVA